MSDLQKNVLAASALLDRADELRADARELLAPLHKARGWKGTADTLSSLMTYDLPHKTSLRNLKALRREKLLKTARDADDAGIAPDRKTRSR